MNRLQIYITHLNNPHDRDNDVATYSVRCKGRFEKAIPYAKDANGHVIKELNRIENIKRIEQFRDSCDALYAGYSSDSDRLTHLNYACARDLQDSLPLIPQAVIEQNHPPHKIDVEVFLNNRLVLCYYAHPDGTLEEHEIPTPPFVPGVRVQNKQGKQIFYFPGAAIFDLLKDPDSGITTITLMDPYDGAMIAECIGDDITAVRTAKVSATPKK